MVYDSIRGQVAYVLKHIRMVESIHRTDGRFPLYERMKGLLLNLDKQSLSISTYKCNYYPVFAISHEYYTIYYLHNGTDAFIISITIEDNGTNYNLRANQRITTDVQFADIPSSYRQYPNGGKFETGNLEFVSKTTSRGGRQRKTYNIFDHSTGKMLFDVDFDELIPISQYNDGIYGKGYYYGDKGWYKLFENGYYEYIDKDELEESRIIRLHLSDIRQIVSECISKIILEQRKKVGKYTIVDGDYMERDLRHLGKGACYDVRMYDEQGASPYNTICLFRRCDNGKYLYTKLVDDESRKGYTKYALMPLRDVPQEIRADFQNLPPTPPFAQEEILWHKMGCPFPYL